MELQRERDELILTSRLKGRTLREIADEHGMTPEDVRLVIARHGRRQIDRIELALLANTKSDDVLAFLIPDHGGEDFDTAMEYCRWVVAELTERGVSVAVHYRPTSNGVVLALEDTTRPRRARA